MPGTSRSPPTIPPSGSDTQVGHLLRRAHQRNTEIFNAVMGAFSVTPTQFAALVTLLDRGATPQNQLGRLTAMDPATIFGVVGRLMKRGYVRQDPVDTDARLVARQPHRGGRAGGARDARRRRGGLDAHPRAAHAARGEDAGGAAGEAGLTGLSHTAVPGLYTAAACSLP